MRILAVLLSLLAYAPAARAQWFGGFELVRDPETCLPQVAWVYAGTDAKRKGLREGDVLLENDMDRSVRGPLDGLTLAEVEDRIQGTAGYEVGLWIRRGTKRTVVRFRPIERSQVTPLTPEQVERLKEQAAVGSAACDSDLGTRFTLDLDSCAPKVLEVRADSAAATAGVAVGDVLIGVDGTDVSAQVPGPPLLARLAGKAGTKVDLTLVRAGRPMHLVVTRGGPPKERGASAVRNPVIAGEVMDRCLFHRDLTAEQWRARQAAAAARRKAELDAWHAKNAERARQMGPPRERANPASPSGTTGGKPGPATAAEPALAAGDWVVFNGHPHQVLDVEGSDARLSDNVLHPIADLRRLKRSDTTRCLRCDGQGGTRTLCRKCNGSGLTWASVETRTTQEAVLMGGGPGVRPTVYVRPTTKVIREGGLSACPACGGSGGPTSVCDKCYGRGWNLR